MNFISMPVISGFASAASLQIAGLQLPKMLGLDLGDVERAETGAGVVDDWIDIVKNIKLSRWQDTVLGISSVIFLLMLRVFIKLILDLSAIIIYTTGNQQVRLVQTCRWSKCGGLQEILEQD